MKIVHRVAISNEDPNNVQSIEFGTVPSWEEHLPAEENGQVCVLRNRYDRAGKFDPTTSSEILIEDLLLMVGVAADHMLLSEDSLGLLHISITRALMRHQVMATLDILERRSDMQAADDGHGFTKTTH